MALHIIGKRVQAWRGSRKGDCGTVIRVDTPYRSEVRWDDGSESWYETSALTTFIKS